MASNALMRWASPRVWPLRVMRFTVAHSRRIMSGGTTGASLCTVNGMPRSSVVRVGLMRDARSTPSTESRCQSPQ